MPPSVVQHRKHGGTVIEWRREGDRCPPSAIISSTSLPKTDFWFVCTHRKRLQLPPQYSATCFVWMQIWLQIKSNLFFYYSLQRKHAAGDGADYTSKPLMNMQQSDLGRPPAGGQALSAPLHHLRGRRCHRWRCAKFRVTHTHSFTLGISAVCRPWPFAFGLTGLGGLADGNHCFPSLSNGWWWGGGVKTKAMKVQRIS